MIKHFYTGEKGAQRQRALLYYLIGTYFDKVDEVVIVLTVERTADRIAPLAAALWNAAAPGADQASITIKEVPALVAFVDHFFGRHAYPHDEELEELVLVDRRKEGPTGD